MNFATLQGLTIPEGKVTNITRKSDGKVLWNALPKFRYVSLGDSIAAGQGIREDAEYQYDACLAWQYGTAGVTSTRIVSGNYTDLLTKKLQSKYGKYNVNTVSYARTGDINKDLRDKLKKTEVANAVANADLVTISIGANTLLGTIGGDALSNFALYGAPALNTISNQMDEGIQEISSGVDTYGSYLNIIARIQELNKNPDAKFVIKTVHNPYKYFWAAESTEAGVPGGGSYTDGFFGPLFWNIFNVNVGSINTRKYVYEYEIEGFSLKNICQRVNDPAGEGWSLADFVEQKIIMLNNAIKNAIDETRKTDKRFILADSKSVWDSYPDDHLRGHDTYSTLLNVEITRERNIQEMNWGSFWDGIFNGLSANDIINGDISGIMGTIFASLATVFVQDADPHPKEGGHYADYRAFANALGLEELKHYTVKYNGNGAIGTMDDETVTAVGYNASGTPIAAYLALKTNKFTPAVGYHFTNWEHNNNRYNDYVFLSSDITLNAQWEINTYTITYKITRGDVVRWDSGFTIYCGLYKGGVNLMDLTSLGQSRTFTVQHGEAVGVIVKTRNGTGRSYITINGVKENANNSYNDCTIYPNGDVTINFEWNHWYDPSEVGYWNCYITGGISHYL